MLKMDNDTDINYIEELFGGDIVEAESAWATGRRYTIHFDDIMAAANVLPELEQEGHLVIEQVLGYLPNPRVTVPFEPYLRGLIRSYRQGFLSENEYKEQLEDHIKLIRNADMVDHRKPDYHHSLYKQYHQQYYTHGYIARHRLCWALGYEPQLVHSLVAELWLREVMALDKLPLPAYLTPIDYKAITIVRYREGLLSQSKSELGNSNDIII